MIITCPRCKTSFSLPDEMFRLGRKARCSNCSNIFEMTDDVIQKETRKSKYDDDSVLIVPPPPVKKRLFSSEKSRKYLLLAAIVVCLSGLLIGGYFVVSSFLGGSHVEEQAKQSDDSLKKIEEDKIKAIQEKLKDIVLEDVRQTVVYNDAVTGNNKSMPLIVIEGYAVNNFPTARAYIEVEGRLLDQQGKMVGSPIIQPCGVVLTYFQLQQLPYKDMLKKLNDSFQIYTVNGNVPSGGKVPFMLVFYGAPEDYYAFEVRVVDVQEPKAEDGSGASQS